MLDYDEEKFRKREACDYANRPLDEITDSCTVRSADTLTVASRGEEGGRVREREKEREIKKKRKIDATSAKCEVA